MRWLIMCCTLMGRRRAAFSRPFARPLASRLTDPTPAYTHRTLYSLPLHTQFARDHSRLHAHTHRPISSASFFQTRIPTSFPSKHLDFCPPGLFPSPDFIPYHRIGHRCSVCSRVPSLTTSPLQGFSLRSTLASSICTSNTATTPESVQSTTLRYYTPFIHTITHNHTITHTVIFSINTNNNVDPRSPTASKHAFFNHRLLRQLTRRVTPPAADATHPARRRRAVHGPPHSAYHRRERYRACSVLQPLSSDLILIFLGAVLIPLCDVICLF